MSAIPLHGEEARAFAVQHGGAGRAVRRGAEPTLLHLPDSRESLAATLRRLRARRRVIQAGMRCEAWSRAWRGQ